MSYITERRRPGTVSFVRFKLGLSQQQLADTLGVSRSVIAMYETGKRKLPRSVRDIYMDMCKSAEAINPEGDICIKRGRKPAFNNYSIVTNGNNITENHENEVFAAWLKRKKDSLRYQQAALQFKKRAIEERHRKFSDKLIYVTAMLNVSRELMDKLLEGELRDKYELRAAVLYAKQVRLKQQLRKCGPVAKVQIEFQMNLFENSITMTEESIAALNNEREISIDTIILKSCSPPGENSFTGIVKKGLQCERVPERAA